jgi:hypothetical protein
MREYDFKATYVRRLRAIPDSVALQLPLPRIDPSLVSALSIVTSLAFLLVLKHSHLLALVLIVVTISLDWLDGLIAKKHELCSRNGYLVDLVADRASEAIMFIPFPVPWSCLFVLNAVLTLFGVAAHKHVILPLRQLFVVAFFLFEVVWV